MRRPLRTHRGMGHRGGGARSLPPMLPVVPVPRAEYDYDVPPLYPSLMHPPLPVAVSSRTNSSDPAAKDSRLFVGNLNTLALQKEDVEDIFSRYGYVIAISMHRGYAFVQFGDPTEARVAGANEDGKIYAGQPIDINVVSQPKNREGLKRSAGDKSSKDAKKQRSEGSGSGSMRGGSAGAKSNKRTAANNAVKRAMATATRRAGNNRQQDGSTPQGGNILEGSSCTLSVSSLQKLSGSKKVCYLRVCVEDQVTEDDQTGPDMLECATCEAQFSNAWELCQHCTEEHQMNIYKQVKEDQGKGEETKPEASGDGWTQITENY